MKNFKFIQSGDIAHVYQLSSDKGVIFYETSDFIVFFTFFCSLARKAHLKPIGLCIMLNHFHMSLYCNDSEDIFKIRSFMQSLKKQYARHYNSYYDREGPLFTKGFGISLKHGGKAIRTHLAYLYNNPVEKKCCIRAEEYRWNFLAYIDNPHPFSDNVPLRECSIRFRTSIQRVRQMAENNMPITHEMMDSLRAGLDNREKKMLADHIVNAYMCIDMKKCIDYYGRKEAMLNAFANNTGSEYDIDEDRGPSSYMGFRALMAASIRLGYTGRMRKFHSLTPEKLYELAREMRRETNAAPYQIASFLHIKN